MLFDYSKLEPLKKEELEPGMEVYAIHWVRKSSASLSNDLYGDHLQSEGIWAVTQIRIKSLSAKKNKMHSDNGKEYDLRYYSNNGHPLRGLKFFRSSPLFKDANAIYTAFYEVRSLYTSLMGKLHGTSREDSEMPLVKKFNYSNFSSVEELLGEIDKVYWELVKASEYLDKATATMLTVKDMVS